MIPALLHQLDSAKARTHLPWRSLCGPVPYPSVMRWRQRRRLNQPVCQSPGPKKTEPFNAAQFYPLLRELNPGPSRTPGSGELYAQFAEALSRRQFQALVREQRQDQLQAMKRITWLHPGTAWSCDATEQDNHQIIVVQDLAARYRCQPLVLEQLDGAQIAAHLEALFRQHGAPLFLKRDNGSPFNGQAVDDVMARFGVLPLNNPPRFPRYNGAIEKSIRDFKAALVERLQRMNSAPAHFTLAVELTAHDLNHRPRRCLQGRTACAVFHDKALRRRWNRHERKAIFRLLRQKFGRTIGLLPEDDRRRRHAAAWRSSVEHWLRCQNLISVRQNQKPEVSTTSQKIWSQN
jgi:transposase InsO family protein